MLVLVAVVVTGMNVERSAGGLKLNRRELRAGLWRHPKRPGISPECVRA